MSWMTRERISELYLDYIFEVHGQQQVNKSTAIISIRYHMGEQMTLSELGSVSLFITGQINRQHLMMK